MPSVFHVGNKHSALPDTPIQTLRASARRKTNNNVHQDISFHKIMVHVSRSKASYHRRKLPTEGHLSSLAPPEVEVRGADQELQAQAEAQDRVGVPDNHARLAIRALQAQCITRAVHARSKFINSARVDAM